MTLPKIISNETDKEQEVQKKHKLSMYNYKKKLPVITDFIVTIFIDNVPQIVQFLNLICLPDDPNNNISLYVFATSKLILSISVKSKDAHLNFPNSFYDATWPIEIA